MGPDLRSHFILILPALARKALSGSAAQMDTFSQLVQRVSERNLMQLSPWHDTSWLKSSKLREQILAAALHQFTCMEWDACDTEGHSRLSFCISTISYLVRIEPYQFGQMIQTKEYFLEIYKAIWLLLQWYMRLSSNPAFTASDEDKAEVHKIINMCFDRFLPYYVDGDTFFDFRHFTPQVSSRRILALPDWLWDTEFCKGLGLQDMDSLFCHFFRINAHHANPEFPATEEDRSSTLKALVQSASY
jgi:hypothetical protein